VIVHKTLDISEDFCIALVGVECNLCELFAVLLVDGGRL
jgi:hypothetical protein